MSERAQSPAPLVPPLALAAFIACIAGAGFLANCSVLAALLRTTRNGILSIVIQLAIADFILIATLGPELWTSNAKEWHFGHSGCIAYQGLSVLASTASAYLVTTIALHTLATINLEKKAIVRRNKRNHDEDEEMRSSRHSLVANSDSSTPPRTMNVDYRLLDTNVPVAPPSTFVWVLAASLSIPEFVLATTIPIEHDNVIICTTVDTNHRVNMHTMLAVFVLLLPTFIMSIAGILVAFKLKTKKRSLQTYQESVSALRLSLWLIMLYCALCVPRAVTTVYRVYSMTTSDNEISPIDLTPKRYTIAILSLAFSGAYLSAALIRPILCIVMLPRLRKVFRDRDNHIDDV